MHFASTNSIFFATFDAADKTLRPLIINESENILAIDIIFLLFVIDLQIIAHRFVIACKPV
jgi:hypothetical protein